jgi:GGDEF domain-containing protein
VDFRSKGGLKSLVLPGGVLLGTAVALVQSGFLKGSGSAVDFFYYTAFATGLLLSWRFHSSRVFSALVLLLLAQRAVEFFSNGRIPTAGPGLTALEAVSFLIPLNLVLLVFVQERGLTLPAIVPRFVLLFVESIFVAVICRPHPAAGSGFLHGALASRSWFSWTEVPQISLLAFVVAAAIFLVRALTRCKPIETGFTWALLSFFMALNAGGLGTAARAYIATAAIILAVSIIETSYAMAYHDELTGLPSRRAFNGATLRLETPYSVAVVDIDHFKSVNDTYGHETGDDVLCMVAARLLRVTGGGQAFRVGGEEFSILFPGKPVRQIVEDLDLLRLGIEQSAFRLRGTDRRTAPRGPDRRSAAAQKKGPRLRAKSQLPTTAGELRITVSIGVAESLAKCRNPDGVIALADKALYRAKQAGRNRVEIAGGTHTRGKRKAAQNIA